VGADLTAAAAAWPEGWAAFAPADRFIDNLGPVRVRHDGPATRVAMEARDGHANNHGVVHGGVLLTLADLSFWAIGLKLNGGRNTVTVSLTGDFTSAGRVGDLLIAEVEPVRETGSMVFLRGILSAAGAPLLAFSGIIKKAKG